MDIKSPEYRITLGTIGFAWSIVMGTLDAVLESVAVDSGIILAVIGFSSGLLGAGLLKKKEKPVDEAVGASESN